MTTTTKRPDGGELCDCGPTCQDVGGGRCRYHALRHATPPNESPAPQVGNGRIVTVRDIAELEKIINSEDTTRSIQIMPDGSIVDVPSPAPQAWRDINTAPRDGTDFLAWQDAERGPFKCWWHTEWPRAEAYWMDPQDSEPEPKFWQPMLPVPLER